MSLLSAPDAHSGQVRSRSTRREARCFPIIHVRYALAADPRWSGPAYFQIVTECEMGFKDFDASAAVGYRASCGARGSAISISRRAPFAITNGCGVRGSTGPVGRCQLQRYATVPSSRRERACQRTRLAPRGAGSISPGAGTAWNYDTNCVH